MIVDRPTTKARSFVLQWIGIVALALVLLACGSSSESTGIAAAGAPAEAASGAETETETVAQTEPANNTAEHDHDHADDQHDADHESDADHEHDAEHDHDHADDQHDADHESDADHEHDADGETAAAVGDGATTNAATIAVANSSYLDSYTLIDESFGTMVTVSVDDTTRTISSNALPNHDTGDFPNSGNPNTISAQDRTWTLPTTPTFTGLAMTVREPGVALNGVKFEPGTAEVVSCASGEDYRIEGLQDMFNLGMDFNNAHVQPTGEYHYHGVSELLVDAFEDDADLVLVGFAADGHHIYYSKSSAYTSSYALSTAQRTGTDCSYRTGSVDLSGTTADGTYVSDWIYTDGQGDLDGCNGTIVGDHYAYLITEQYPYIPRCLMGEFTEAGPGAGAPAPGAEAGGAPGQGGAPDLTGAAEALGITSDELQSLLGGPPPDFDAAAAALGISAEDFLAVLSANGAAPPTH